MQEATNQAGIESTFKIVNVIGGRLSLTVGPIAFLRQLTPQERRFGFGEGTP